MNTRFPSAATGEADFRSTSVDLVFSPTILSRTVMIEIIDDLLLERNEMFTSRLTLTTTDVSIMLVPQEASITIIDNDRKLTNIASLPGPTQLSSLAVQKSGESLVCFLMVSIK